jgi:hypothetical protein
MKHKRISIFLYIVNLFVVANFFIAPSVLAESTDAQKAITEFENIVEKVKRGITDVKKLAAGSFFYVIWIEAQNVSYDVQETRSLISPYTGIIKIQSLNRTNSKSLKADHFYSGERLGFTTASAALAASEPQDFDKPGLSKWNAHYAYQKGRWVFIEPEKEGILYRLRGHQENLAFLNIFLP